MSAEFKVTALHGFAGLPSDWDSFSFIENKINLWKLPLSAYTSLNAGAQALNQITAQDPSPKKILLGYSLGGRLALQMLLQNPQRWAGAILVSTNLGLKNSEECQRRILNDETWALKWQSEEWRKVCQEWNAQPVLQTSASSEKALVKNEKDFDRGVLAQAMRGWSLGHQSDLRESALHLSLPVLWLAGERDAKFSALQNEFRTEAQNQKQFQHQFTTLAGAGHRLPWDEPASFEKSVRPFMDSLAIVS